MADESNLQAAPVKARNFSPWHQWMARLAETEQLDAFPAGEPAQFDEWRGRVRQRLDAMLGPVVESVPLDLETTESVACDGYRRDRIVFDSEAGMSVPAYLLVPDGRTEPDSAVLAVHGHGPGKSQACGLESPGSDASSGDGVAGDAIDATDGGDEHSEADLIDDDVDPNADYAHQLALRGHLVLAPDLRCFGERADWNPPDHYGCDTNLVHAVMAGVSPLAQNLADLARCLDVLEEHPLVDRARIGMVGLSYGATCTLFLAALDSRVSAAVVSGYFSSWAEAHKMPWNMCGSQVLPGMLGQIEHVDLAALVAPRPLLVETGSNDFLFPLAAATASVAQLREVYASLAADDRLVHDVFQGGHQWHGVEAYPFLDRWLG